MYYRELRTVRLAVAAIAAAAFFGIASAAKATVFYVSPSGRDSHRGTSPGAAWRTVARVNRAAFRPGDTVLFRGGSAFRGELMPRTSGRRGAPITFASYGTGKANVRGGITLVSKSWIAITSLRVERRSWRTAGDSYGLMSHDRGPGSKHISVSDCSFRNLRFGLLLSNHGDESWVVRNTVIQSTRDSGIVIFDPFEPTGLGGDHLLFEDNSVLDTGLDSSIASAKHAVYDKGTNTTFRGNVIRRWSAQRAYPAAGLSIRAHGTTIEGNHFSGGPYGIAWTGYDPTGGTTRIVGNDISRVTYGGISLTWRTGPVPTRESFVVDGNTIATTVSGSRRADAIFTQPTAGSIAITRNVVSGVHRYALWVEGVPRGGFTENHNHWNGNHGAERWNFIGVPFLRLVAYQLASHQGVGDTVGP